MWDWTEIAAWVGWAATAGLWAWGARQRRPPTQTTDCLTAVLMRGKEIESVRLLKRGQRPLLITRPHGKDPATVYRFDRQDGDRLYYTVR